MGVRWIVVASGGKMGHNGRQTSDYHQTGFGLSLHLWDALELQASYLVAVIIKGKKNLDSTLVFNDSPAHFVGLGLQGHFAL